MIFTENWSVVRQIHDLKEEWRNCVRSNVIIEFYRFDFDKKKTLLKCANTSQSHYRNENVIENEPLQLNKHKRLLRQTASTTTIRIEIYLSKRLSPALYILTSTNLCYVLNIDKSIELMTTTGGFCWRRSSSHSACLCLFSPKFLRASLKTFKWSDYLSKCSSDKYRTRRTRITKITQKNGWKNDDNCWHLSNKSNVCLVLEHELTSLICVYVYCMWYNNHKKNRTEDMNKLAFRRLFLFVCDRI